MALFQGTDLDEIIIQNFVSPTVTTTPPGVSPGAAADTVYAEGGADLVKAGQGDDTIFGGDGNDELHGQKGNDTLQGNRGDDILYGELGDDLLKGGMDDDRLYGGDGADTLYGDLGNDSLYGDAGDDLIEGGDGDDWIIGGGGGDTLYGNLGDDVIVSSYDYDEENLWALGDGAADDLHGGEGCDVLVFESGDSADGGPGDDELQLYLDMPVAAAVDGGAGHDLLTIWGDGDIRVDLVAGLISQPGGSMPTSTITGIEDVEAFDDHGSHIGNLTLIGDANDNYLGGGYGDDSLSGGDGDDDLYGDASRGHGNDTLNGNRGDDRLWGGDGDDLLKGGKDDDMLDGGAGADVLKGQLGNDTLDGGAGSDTLAGGPGDDVFVFATGDSVATARDRIVSDGAAAFEAPGAAAGDLIDLSGYDADADTPGIQNFEWGGSANHGAGFVWTENSGNTTLVRGAVDGAPDLVIAIEDGAGVQASAYSAADFILGDRIPGDASTTAEIAVGGAARSSLDFPGDDDWFRVELEAGKSYTFELSGDDSSDDPLADPFLYLYDSDSNLVALNDDYLDLDSRLSYAPADDELVFVSARAYEDAYTGDYVLSVSASDPSGPVLLANVPAYDWYHGCCPTAAGSIVGYWDLQGYPNLFDAQGLQDVMLTDNVQDQISSPAHNAKYDPTPDDTTLPVPPMTSLAGFMGTSVDPLSFGATYVNHIGPGFEGYTDFRGYDFRSTLIYNANTGSTGGSAWEAYVAEIDAGRPVQLTVDWTGDGVLDHCIPGIGYEDRGANGFWYAAYTTWSESETPIWEKFRPAANGDAWGVGYLNTVVPDAAPSLDLVSGTGVELPDPPVNDVPTLARIASALAADDVFDAVDAKILAQAQMIDFDLPHDDMLIV